MTVPTMVTPAGIDAQRLKENVETCQADALGLLADEAQDREDTTLAGGYRWLARHKKWPTWRWQFQEKSGYWYWSHEYHDADGEGFADSEQLPRRASLYVPDVRATLVSSLAEALEFAARCVGEALARGEIRE